MLLPVALVVDAMSRGCRKLLPLRRAANQETIAVIRFFVALFGVMLAAVQPVAAAAPPNFIFHEAPKELPEVQFEDEGAHSHSLAEFRGKVVLLNVWATWGAPCRDEIANARTAADCSWAGYSSRW
jgi:hypothetical protein